MKNSIFSLKPFLLMVLISFSATIISCEKDEHEPPEISFKTGGNYISSNQTVEMEDTLLVGVKVVKTEDELKTLNISAAYDGDAAVTKDNITLTEAEEDGFERDITVVTRNLAGTEVYTFTVTDRDGNIAQKSITLTVQ